MLLFCRLRCLCFCGQLVPCVSASFCSPIFACCLMLGNISEVCFWLRFFLPLFAFFLVGLLFFFLLCVSLLFVTRAKYRRPGPYGHSNAFLACPPTLHWPTTPMLTIHGHLCTSDLVCVPVASVHVCFWSCAHVVRSCACVFADTHGAWMCVLGMLGASRYPQPNPEQSYELL